jgi:hypothetical protein
LCSETLTAVLIDNFDYIIAKLVAIVVFAHNFDYIIAKLVTIVVFAQRVRFTIDIEPHES